MQVLHDTHEAAGREPLGPVGDVGHAERPYPLPDRCRAARQYRSSSWTTPGRRRAGSSCSGCNTMGGPPCVDGLEAGTRSRWPACARAWPSARSWTTAAARPPACRSWLDSPGGSAAEEARAHWRAHWPCSGSCRPRTPSRSAPAGRLTRPAGSASLPRFRQEPNGGRRRRVHVLCRKPPPTMEAPMQTVTPRDGTTIAYEAAGGGPAVVLVGTTASDHHALDGSRGRSLLHHPVPPRVGPLTSAPPGAGWGWRRPGWPARRPSMDRR